MTKKYEFKWVIPVPEELKEGCSFDRWFETKDIQDFEKDCTFKVDEYGFFLYWKSEDRVRCCFLGPIIVFQFSSCCALNLYAS